jgi:alkanesulfonate monooxygenase SsuD/methylene tetrahydromethanopterin reductase-like flavin-dependent oxidoreductase (luciferase family)
MSPSGLRRAARYGNGWYGFALDLDATRHALEGLRAAEQRFDRSAALGRLEITVTPTGAVDADAARAYQALGVDRLVLLNLGRNADDQIRFVEKAGRELVAAFA